jgi:riboflavin kinase/FMN adenylyltransferase
MRNISVKRNAREIIRGIPARLAVPHPVVTIGNFDGVHIGHRKIFAAVAAKAKELGGVAIAITFDPHPMKVLFPERGVKLITTFEDRAALMFQAGIEKIIAIPFSREFAHTEADAFIEDVLAGALHAEWIIVGHNYAFGKGKKGTPDLLRQYGRRFGFGVSVVRYALIASEIVSSSRVRTAIHAGRVHEAGRMLGRAYHIDGTVIRGAGRGERLLHTPTANIATMNENTPKDGVYAVRVSIGVELFDGVMNIGDNPTFQNTARSCEVHIFGLSRDLLGRRLRVHFIDRVREERKFSGPAELLLYINRDIIRAKTILAADTTPLYR